MSQDKEREAFERRMLDFGWRNFTGDVQGEPPCWYYANADLNARWIGWREARAALASQQAVKGEPIGWASDDGRVVSAELVKRYPEYRIGYNTPLFAHPPSREPLPDDVILDAFCHTPGIHQFVQAFKAGARFAERAHGIHSREGGSNG